MNSIHDWIVTPVPDLLVIIYFLNKRGEHLTRKKKTSLHRKKSKKENPDNTLYNGEFHC